MDIATHGQSWQVTVYAKYDIPNKSAKRLSFTFKADLVYPQPTCRSHPKHSEIAIGFFFAVRRSPYTDLPCICSWLNSIWKGQAVASGKWWDSTEKNLALNHDYWQASTAQGDSGDTGQSVISTKQEWKQAKQGRCGKCHKHKIKTHRGFDRPRSQTVQREIRLHENSFLCSVL